MKNTIKDVAKAAGVSIATVSRIINKNGSVSCETRKIVEEVIERLNFQPDQAARTMVMKVSKYIGLIIPNLSNEYWAVLTEVIQRELWTKGYNLMLCIAGEDKESLRREKEILKKLLERNVDGVIYYHPPSSSNGSKNNIIEKYVDAGIPIVTLEQELPFISRVSGDHFHGAKNAVDHLINLGHRKIAFIGGTIGIPEREFGYRNALMFNNIAVNEKLIRRTQSSFNDGFEAVKDLIDSKKDFTAVFCWNDLIAFGAIKALENASINVPKDIAVVGYDDITMASLFKPALTTVRQPMHEIGVNVVELLFETIKNQGTNFHPKNILLQMQLVIRESCGSKLVKDSES